jgi:hypothetical protein
MSNMPGNSPQPYETPMRANSFFAHLNYDVRCLIYDFLDLPPISHSCLGLIMSCKEAKADTTPAAARNLKRYLTETQRSFNRHGYSLILPIIALDADHNDLKDITITTSWWTVYEPWHGLSKLLGCYFSTVTIVCKTPQEMAALAGADGVVSEATSRNHVLDFAETDEKIPNLYERARWVMNAFMLLLDEKEYKLRRPHSQSSTSPARFRTTTFKLVWRGTTHENLRAAVFDYLSFEYNTAFKENWRQQYGIAANYPWPTLTEISTANGDAGSMALTSKGRWVDGLDRIAMGAAWRAEKDRKLWLREWKDAPLN